VLGNLYCGGNVLSALDVSGNLDLWNLFIEDMPTLTAVCVWELPFPPENVMVGVTGSPNAYFTTECSK